MPSTSSSTSSSSNVKAAGLARVSGGAMLACGLWGLSGCAAAPDAVTAEDRVRGGTPLIAVFPVENLSGRPAPLGEVRRLLIERTRSEERRVGKEGRSRGSPYP